MMGRRDGPTLPEHGMSATHGKVLQQCGALPYFVDDNGGIRVLLVTTRGSRQWVIPKGWPMRNRTAADSAVREAYEEAGLLGSVIGEAPIGCYRYAKRRGSRKAAIFEVSVFLFAVERQLAKWPEKAERKTRWFDAEEASAFVASSELADIVRTAKRQLARPAGE